VVVLARGFGFIKGFEVRRLTLSKNAANFDQVVWTMSVVWKRKSFTITVATDLATSLLLSKAFNKENRPSNHTFSPRNPTSVLNMRLIQLRINGWRLGEVADF
jgi:hypothetical protein